MSKSNGAEPSFGKATTEREARLARARSLTGSVKGELENHPDCATLMFRGDRRRWFVGNISYEVAKIMGHDTVEMAQSNTSAVSNVAYLLWLGFLAFDPEVEPFRVFSLREYNRYKDVVLAFMRDTEEAMDESLATDPSAEDSEGEPLATETQTA